MTTPYPALVLHSGADREQLKAVLINELDSLLPQLFPEGRREGHEFLIGDLRGSPGRSLRVELAGEKRGLWNDFESGEGGDVIDLWASKYGLDARRNFPEVLRQFKQKFGTFIQPKMRPSPSAPSAPAHGALGTPSDQWDYLDATGRVMVTMFRSKKFIQIKSRIEWQANYYSGCLLMPRHLVIAALNEIDWYRFPHSSGSFAPSESFCLTVYIESWNFYGHKDTDVVERVFDRMVRPLATKFLVSCTAMRIRLEDLQLLRRVVAPSN